MNKNKTLILYISLFVNIILIVMCVSLLNDLNRSRNLQDIKGFYQSTENLPEVYYYNFVENNKDGGEFYYETNDYIEKGIYERYKDNIYIRYGKEEIVIITLGNKGFSFYDHENNRVVEMKKLSEIPTHIRMFQ